MTYPLPRFAYREPAAYDLETDMGRDAIDSHLRQYLRDGVHDAKQDIWYQFPDCIGKFGFSDPDTGELYVPVHQLDILNVIYVDVIESYKD